MAVKPSVKLTAPPAGLIVAILTWILGKQISGPTLQVIGQVGTLIFASLTAHVHGPTIVAATKKVVATVKKTPAAVKTVHRTVKKTVAKAPVVRKVVKGDITMYDSIEVSAIPGLPQAVAGYVGGLWPTYSKLLTDFPKAKHLSIAVNAGEDADALDVEAGDATPAQVPEWVKRQVARGVKRPVVYASVAAMQAIVTELRKAGIPRTAVRLWTAHYTYRSHRCGPACGFGFTYTADATQYSDHALNRNLDVSRVAGSFFG